jgi:hypothetical protein
MEFFVKSGMSEKRPMTEQEFEKWFNARMVQQQMNDLAKLAMEAVARGEFRNEPIN